jgi:hypothetical protein
MAVIPFAPWNLLARISTRGLDWKAIPEEVLDGSTIVAKQAGSFLIIYLLSGLSVKYFVDKLVGEKAPDGADRGILSVMESPKGQRLMKSMGIDPDDFKTE